MNVRKWIACILLLPLVPVGTLAQGADQTKAVRIDPWDEATTANIATLLRDAGGIVIGCDETEVDMHICKVFSRQLRVTLGRYYSDRKSQITIYLWEDPNPFPASKSFLVQPKMIPMKGHVQVTLRLIESNSGDDVILGGNCFDLSADNSSDGIKLLPAWKASENGGSMSGEENAAEALAKAFAEYWRHPTAAKNPPRDQPPVRR